MSVKNRLKSYILSKSIGNNTRKIGIEVECFIFDKNKKRIPVNKCDTFSASDLLEELNLNSKNSADQYSLCLLYTSPSPRDGLLSRMPSSA